eukprot:6206524-Pleurochrysis_carterae.AAC.2
MQSGCTTLKVFRATCAWCLGESTHESGNATSRTCRMLSLTTTAQRGAQYLARNARFRTEPRGLFVWRPAASICQG